MPDFERLILNRDVKRIIRLLSSRRTELRLRAAQALGEARAWRAIPELRAALDDPEPLVRTAALDALASIHRSDSFDALVDALHSPHHEIVEHAWRLLSRSGEEGGAAIARGLPAFREDEEMLARMLAHLDAHLLGGELLSLLEHPDEAVVERAREKLAAKGEAADEALFTALREGSEKQADEAAAILRPRVAALVPRLIALYGELAEPERQRKLLYVLSETRAPDIATLLERELRNPDSRVRTTAMALLSRYREPAVAAFKKLLKEPDFPDRTRLIAFVRQHWRLWGDALLDLLATDEFDEWRVREFVKVALGGRGHMLPSVVERFLAQGDLAVDDVADLLLFDAAAKPDNVALLCRDPGGLALEPERRLARLFDEILRREGPAAPDLLRAVASTPVCLSPRLPVRLLAQQGEAAVPALVELLRHQAQGAEPEVVARAGRVRREALATVVEHAAEAIPLLVQALQRPDATAEVHEAVLRSGDRALPGLVAALEASWRDGRDWRTWSDLLSRMAGQRTDVLLPLLSHEEPEIRRAVFATLRGRKGDELEQAMVDLVNAAVGVRHVDPEVLWALEVLGGLRGLGARAAMQRLVTHPDPRVREQALRYVRRMVRFPSGVWQKLGGVDGEPE